MSKFTKGKWEVYSSTNGIGVFDEDGELVKNIADSIYGNEANAKLIAAAPEMYELLKEIKEQSGIQCDMDCDKTGKAISRNYRIYLSLDLYNKIQPLLERIDEEKTT